MEDVEHFALIICVGALISVVAILSNRLSARLFVPAPAIFLVCAAVASELVPGLRQEMTPDTVQDIQRVVTVALAVILFDGGMQIGWRRFRSAAGPVVVLGVVGTFLTAGAVAALAHGLFGIPWLPALLLGTALAPTDPAVVFSVLGRREVGGRTGTILEGESGANDPVGITLMVSLLGAAGGGLGGATVDVVVGFVVQMVVGAAVGVAGGFLLLAFMRRVPLPSPGLYPMRALAGALAIYGLAGIAHGSGFLAVFVAGILVGDARAPYKAEIEQVHSALASLAEIVAFLLLGLTVPLGALGADSTWQVGLALAVLLAFVVRPVLVGLLLVPMRLRAGEKAFLLWAGLKGAVPVLLGTFVLTAGAAGATRIDAIVFVVVAFSVVLQGGLVPYAARRLRVPMRIVEPEPWTLGLRFRSEPRGTRRYVVAAGSVADGTPIEDLPVGEDAWISFILRQGHLVQVRGSTTLQVGDELVVLVDPSGDADVAPIFTAPRPAE